MSSIGGVPIDKSEERVPHPETGAAVPGLDTGTDRQEGSGGGADLHTHTTASDGTLSPADLVTLAAHIGLEALGVTDHDTMAGLPEAESSARRQGLQVVPGVEVNTEYRGREVHVLGYFCRGDGDLAALLARMRRARVERMVAMVDRLRRAGIPVTLEDVEKVVRESGPPTAGAVGPVSCREPGGSSAAASGDRLPVLGRPHLARALWRLGFAATPAEAFARFLVPGAPGYVPRPKVHPAEVVERIRADGGVPVLAHPGLIGDDSVVLALAAAGLLGLEVWHSRHDEAASVRYLEMAKRYGLLATGGSDFHGPGDDRQLGSVRLPMETVQQLEAVRA